MHKYLKLANFLQDKIENEEIKEKLPSVRQIMYTFNVSQITATKALEVLQSRKLVYVKKK